MTIRIELIEDVDVTVSEFVVLEDAIQILDYYIELLEYNESEYILYIDGVPKKWSV